ncbi:PIG-L deacetylase family protein [Aquirufa aurantiipilula]|uniref:PIG-L family deacetylase n=1 Tax=Aquirufa aurantiipilula TaxID=2696561 RepID=A0ABT6BJ32_9BACT|nr:PIG-L family deacetylase [Aquirufa aurantiipilula]MBZ1326778.1 PIG-L family deacetylase [Aquirufa aurantiipilula]MDF5690210.1 PIG-L family deacetylase [Aquirufa aurantiipilula]
MKKGILLTVLMACVVTWNISAQDRPLQIIMIGAHPDDCDIKSGGTAALFVAMGHHVKFVSVTNGDAGHQTEGGGMLAKRRIAETKEVARRLGVSYDVLDNHDGELLPSLEIRLQIIRKIREWKADVVIAPRSNDYHPDHRYTGVLVQDAAFMVGVPNVAPDVEPLRKNPVFLYFQDNFKKPNPFQADIAVDITPVLDKKLAGLDAHQSQFYEWLPWIGNYENEVPKDPAKHKEYLLAKRVQAPNPEVRKTLEKWYGKSRADQAKYAEAFEICEYGTQPTEQDIRRLFPMLGK